MPIRRLSYLGCFGGKVTKLPPLLPIACPGLCALILPSVLCVNIVNFKEDAS